jgi:hypothetical protein
MPQSPFCMMFSAGTRDRDNVPPESWLIDKSGNKTWKRAVRAFVGKCVVTAPLANLETITPEAP